MSARPVIPCGAGGCCARMRRRGVERFCAQTWIYRDRQGRGWCYYHKPGAPRKFGEGYVKVPQGGGEAVSAQRDKERLAGLDRDIDKWKLRELRARTLRDRTLELRARARIAHLDERRKAVRLRIKKHTGRGVGGSARRRTRRSVGSSPTAPTNLEEARPC